MVVAADRVAETVAVVERPGYQQATVYSEVAYSDNRRHKEQVDFRPVLHPVKYSDTAYLWMNSSRRRFVSRTYYEPRVRPRAYSETTFVRPKTAEERFVSCLDIRADSKRKWFKTSVDIKPRKFTSSKVIRSANNNYIGNDTAATTTTTTTTTSTVPNGNGSFEHENGITNGDGIRPHPIDRLAGGDYSSDSWQVPTSRNVNGGFAEHSDPGASQVYIPRPLKRPLSEDCLLNGDLLIDLPNGDGSFGRTERSHYRYPDLL